MLYRRLFLDNAHIEKMRDVVRVGHQAEKYAGNPVVVPDLPWERSMGHNHGSLMLEDGRFKYWYQMFAFADEAFGTFHCAYAESDDGLSWEKPELGLVPINGEKRGNIVAYDIGGINIVRDEHDADPEKRYKMLYFGSGEDKRGTIPQWMGSPGHWAWCLSFSPDGLRWNPHPGNPVYTGAGDDGSFLGWDDDHDCYAAYLRPCMWKPGEREIEADGHDGTSGDLHGWHRGGPAPIDDDMKRFPHRRLIGRATTVNFEDWSTTSTVIAPDNGDPTAVGFYSMPVYRYQGWYIGLVYMLYGEPEEPVIRKKGLMDIQLAASRDGIAWSRIGGHCPLIPRGRRGSFDAGMVGPNNGLIEKDGKIWLYYNGWTGEHRETKAYRRANDPGLYDMGRLGSGTGLAWLRQDGFVSLDSGEDEGVMISQAETANGSDLMINAVTHGDGGVIRAEIMRADGKPVPGYSGADAAEFRGDSIGAVMTWAGKPLAALPEGTYRLRFLMRHTSLYSYLLGAGGDL